MNTYGKFFESADREAADKMSGMVPQINGPCFAIIEISPVGLILMVPETGIEPVRLFPIAGF